MTEPILWWLSRATGVVLLVVMTATTVLGVLAAGRSPAPVWPRFVTQGVHRALGGLTVALLLGHATVVVVDEFVDVRWWHAISPVGASYEPLWLGLGALALDLTVVAAVTAVVRARLRPGAWRRLHLVTYAAWGLAVAHGLGIGTDAGATWLRAVTAICVLAVASAALTRVVGLVRHRTEVPA